MRLFKRLNETQDLGFSSFAIETAIVDLAFAPGGFPSDDARQAWAVVAWLRRVAANGWLGDPFDRSINLLTLATAGAAWKLAELQRFFQQVEACGDQGLASAAGEQMCEGQIRV